MAGAVVLVLAVVAYGLGDPWLRIAVGVLAVVLFAMYFVGVLWFANKHPGLALLEGAELIQWRQLDMTASDLPPQIDNQPIEPPLIEQNDERR